MIVIKFICTSAFIRSLKKRSINILIHIKEQNKTKYDKTIRRQTKKKLAVNIIFRTLNEKKTDLTSLHEGVEERCIDEEEQVGAEL